MALILRGSRTGLQPAPRDAVVNSAETDRSGSALQAENIGTVVVVVNDSARQV